MSNLKNFLTGLSDPFSPIGFDFYSIVPSLKLCKRIQQNMLDIDYDRINFEAIVFEDCFTVYAKYTQIIGDCLIGVFDISELPINIKKDTTNG